MFEITTGKGNLRIYKYDQHNWPHPYPNNNFFIPKRVDTSIQTQRTSDSDASVDAHYLASAGLDQSTNHCGNTDVRDNDYSRSFETPRGNDFSSSYFGDTITISNTPYLYTLRPHVK